MAKYNLLSANISKSNENLSNANFTALVDNDVTRPIIRKCVFVYKTINGEVDNWKKDIVDLF